jgi:hypothetical protein
VTAARTNWQRVAGFIALDATTLRTTSFPPSSNPRWRRQQWINPFPNQEQTFVASPASKAVRAKAGEGDQRNPSRLAARLRAHLGCRPLGLGDRRRSANGGRPAVGECPSPPLLSRPPRSDAEALLSVGSLSPTRSAPLAGPLRCTNVHQLTTTKKLSGLDTVVAVADQIGGNVP